LYLGTLSSLVIARLARWPPQPEPGQISTGNAAPAQEGVDGHLPGVRHYEHDDRAQPSRSL
jgi:hypothetical protein